MVLRGRLFPSVPCLLLLQGTPLTATIISASVFAALQLDISRWISLWLAPSATAIRGAWLIRDEHVVGGEFDQLLTSPVSLHSLKPHRAATITALILASRFALLMVPRGSAAGTSTRRHCPPKTVQRITLTPVTLHLVLSWCSNAAGRLARLGISAGSILGRTVVDSQSIQGFDFGQLFCLTDLSVTTIRMRRIVTFTIAAAYSAWRVATMVAICITLRVCRCGRAVAR